MGRRVGTSVKRHDMAPFLLPLENTTARFVENACAWGRLVKAATAIYLFYPHPLTAETELSWDEAGGQLAEPVAFGEQ